MALTDHYNGHGPIGTLKSQAYSTINALRYNGESQRFTFETYVTKLKNAFEVLREYKEPVPESKKVSDFTSKIHNKHPMVVAALANIKSNPTYKEDFTQASNYLSAIIKEHKPPAQHQVKSLKSQKFKDSQKNKGKGKNKGKPKSSDSTRTNSQKEWTAKSYKEREKIRKDRKDRKRRRAAALAAKKEEDSKTEESDATSLNKK